MWGIIIASLLANALAYAQGVDPFCQSVDANAVQRMASLPMGTYAAWWPEFLEEKDSSGNLKQYAAVMCSSSIHHIANGGNCIVDLQSGKISQAPGWYDGQWTKDHDNESIFTIPNKYPVKKGEAQPGLSFYRYKNVLTNGRGASLLYRDPAFGNHYHSFGVVERGVQPDGQKYVIHRALNDKWGVSYKDYKIIVSASGEAISVEPYSAEKNLTNDKGDTEVVKTSPLLTADPNPHNSYFDLPMISPDGKYFAANNRKTMTTQLFEITSSGQRLVADLGIETGKVSIAPRSSATGDLYLAFHIDQIDPAEGDKMTGVHGQMTKDVVVMRLVPRLDKNGLQVFEPQQMVRVTASGVGGEGNYYPKWINEKELVFIEAKNNNRQTFVKANIDGFHFKPNPMRKPDIGCVDCVAPTEKEYAASTALGFYVANTCTKLGKQVTAKESALYSMVLSKENCVKLADTWESWKNLVASSSVLYDLRAAKKPGVQRVSGYNFHESAAKRGAERFERPVSRDEVSALSAGDLRAVCELL